METLVVGAGAMGRWLGRVVTQSVPESADLTFTDADAAAAEDAAAAVGGRGLSPAEISGERFDAVCIAVPIPAASEAIERYAPQADRAVVDVTGTMAGPIEAMSTHAPNCERVSFHPLFAPDSEPGNIAVVVDESGPLTDALREGLSARDNRLVETTAAEHDEAMETVQARTHAAVLAFALAAEEVPEYFHTPISGELTALAEQMTGGESRVYADIQAAFDGAEDIASAAAAIADATPEEFEQLYEDVGQ